jgi:AraC-like DNA-binding protein
LRYFAPAEDVRDLVSVYYLFEDDQPRFADNERAAIAQLRFLLEGSAVISFADGSSFSHEGAVLQGPSTGAMHVDVTGPFRMFGIGVLPAGWAISTRKSAAEYTDKAVNAAEVFTQEIDKNLEYLRGCKTPEEMVAWADKVYRSLKPRLKPETAAFTKMVDEWLSSEPSPPISGLMERSTQSSRQVLRTVNKLYGMPPKYLARKYRALRAARAYAEHNEEELLELVDAFYDQSHMIREVKFFAGVTPTQLRVGEGEIARLIDQRANLKGKIAPLTTET